MKRTEPPRPTGPDSEREAVAELLGRILAACWLADRAAANETPTGPATTEDALTTPATGTYDGR